MPLDTFKYTNGEVTIVWKPNSCVHSTLCFKGLPGVFDPKKRPWVNPEGASTQMIIEQVRKCPSGALSYFMNENPEALKPEERAIGSEESVVVEIQIIPNGPIAIKRKCLIEYGDGKEDTREGNVTLCRCGASQNKPYCDGSHNKIGFVG